MKPRVRIVRDLPDAPATTRYVTRLHCPARGVVAVRPTPGRGGSGIARDILTALGKRFRPGSPRAAERLLPLARLWLHAERTRHLVITRADRRPASERSALRDLCTGEHAPTLWLIVHRPHLDPDEHAVLRGAHRQSYQRMSSPAGCSPRRTRAPTAWRSLASSRPCPTYAEDRNAYCDALRSVLLRTHNMEFWLDYFLRGLPEEYERVASTVSDLSTLVPGGSGPPLQLSPGQQAALTRLRIEGRREFARRDYEQAARLARSAAGEDLQALVRHGVLHVRGGGSNTRYTFASAVQSPGGSSRGRPTKWTDAAIERELRAFLAGRSTWPSYGEFVAAGRRDLYAAASRNGSIKRWRTILRL